MKVDLASQFCKIIFKFHDLVPRSTYKLRLEVDKTSFQPHRCLRQKSLSCKKCEPLSQYLKDKLKLGECYSADRFLEIRLSVTEEDTKFTVGIEGDLLEELYHLFKSKEKVWINLGFRETQQGYGKHSDPVSDTRSKRMAIKQVNNQYVCEGIMHRPADWWNSNPPGNAFSEVYVVPEHPIQGKIYVQLCIDDVTEFADICRDPPYQKQNDTSEIYAINKQLLETKIGTDMQIILDDGVAIACHKIFFQVHSKSFSICNNKKGRSSLKLSDMTENGVKALLMYLYCRDLGKAESNPSVALELLICANKFDLKQLKSLTKKSVLATTVNSFTTENALDLLHLSFKMDNDENIRKKSEELLKSKTLEDIWQASNFERLCGQFPGFEEEVGKLASVKRS